MWGSLSLEVGNIWNGVRGIERSCSSIQDTLPVPSLEYVDRSGRGTNVGYEIGEYCDLGDM